MKVGHLLCHPLLGWMETWDREVRSVSWVWNRDIQGRALRTLGKSQVYPFPTRLQFSFKTLPYFPLQESAGPP